MSDDENQFGRVDSQRGRRPCQNPFATQRVRPGRIPYQFPAGTTISTLAADLATKDWWGEIVGPHGSGKSALLSCMSSELERRGRWVRRITLHGGEHRLPIDRRDVATWDDYTQVIVDGYEQLWLPGRIWLHAACRRQQAGLLVSAHRSVGLPTLWDTTVSAEMACCLVEEVLSGYPAVIAPQEVTSCLAKHQGNLRETFFELYDLFEQRAPVAEAV